MVCHIYVNVCYSIRFEHQLTFPTTIKLRSHGDVPIPRLWMNPDVACYYWFIQYILHYCVSVRVAKENLDISVKAEYN